MIIQCYRGKLEEGAESPLLITGMNPRYAKLQSFEIMLPALTIPAKVMQGSEVSSSAIEARSQLDKLLAKDKYLKENVEKQNILLNQTQEDIKTHTWNVDSFNDEIKELKSIAENNKKPAHKLKEEQLTKIEEDQEEAKKLLAQIKKKLPNITKAWNKAHKDQDENEKLKKEQVAILEQESNLKATKNWLDIFKYSEDGNVLGVQSYTYKKYNALTQEYLPCGHFNLGLKNNIITLINPFDQDLETQKGDILQFTLIIGS